MVSMSRGSRLVVFGIYGEAAYYRKTCICPDSFARIASWGSTTDAQVGLSVEPPWPRAEHKKTHPMLQKACMLAGI